MKKLLISLLASLLFSSISFAEYYELYYLSGNEPERFYIETSLNEEPQVPEGSEFITRLSMKNASPTKETKDNSVMKENWAILAEQVYTNCLETLGFSGVWTNMDWTFETVGTGIISQMMEAAQAGNVEQMNLLSSYKGIVKDAYDSLLKYTMKYGNDDMRLYPYGSEWIFREVQEWNYIEYDGEKYWDINGPTKITPQDEVKNTNPEEVMIPKEITIEWLLENRDWIKANFVQCPRGAPGDLGIL